MTRTPTAATASDVEDGDCCSKLLEDAMILSSSSSPEVASKKRQKLTWSFHNAEGGEGVNGENMGMGVRKDGSGRWT